MKELYNFIDYRRFLAWYYREQKRNTRHFSYRYFADKAGINSSSFLKHVIEGRRNLTPATANKFCTALQLTPKEANYFRHLVLFNQAKTAVEKQEHYAVLRSMAGGVKEKVLKADMFDYYDKWYTSIIRELVCLKDFQDDFAVLGKAVKPPVSSSEASKSVALLLRLGLIRKLPGGGYEQTDTALVANDKVLSLALRSFTAWMARYTEQAMEVYERGERHISGITLGASHATYELLVAEIEAFKDRVKSIVNQDTHCCRVYQLNLGLFPMSADLCDQIDKKDRPS